MVEQNRSGAYIQIVYAPTGDKLALMNGQTLQKAFVPLPAQATAVYGASGLSYYRHPDWLGSSRFASTPARTMYSDTAYAPFGEPYAQAGTADLSFTGQNQDTVGGSYDFLFREYSTQGRWPSPDPAGLAAVDLSDPQTLNGYVYVRNAPCNLVDPLGLQNEGPQQAQKPVGNLNACISTATNRNYVRSLFFGALDLIHGAGLAGITLFSAAAFEGSLAFTPSPDATVDAPARAALLASATVKISIAIALIRKGQINAADKSAQILQQDVASCLKNSPGGRSGGRGGGGGGGGTGGGGVDTGGPWTSGGFTISCNTTERGTVCTVGGGGGGFGGPGPIRPL